MMNTQILQVPKEIPQAGWLAQNLPFFFRPRMKPSCENAASLDRDCEQLKEKFPWKAHSSLVLEYCSGNGHWIVDRAKKHPEFYWIALEKRLDRAKKILSKMQFEKVENLAIACTEAKWFSHHLLDSESLDGVYINFPDPWPKDKHARHRLFESEFINDVVRALKPGACLQLVTDDYRYLTCAIEVMNRHASLEAMLEDVLKEVDIQTHGYSYFADLWRSKGLKLYCTQYRRLKIHKEEM